MTAFETHEKVNHIKNLLGSIEEIYEIVAHHGVREQEEALDEIVKHYKNELENLVEQLKNIEI
jgi:hypothetical protein